MRIKLSHALMSLRPGSQFAGLVQQDGSYELNWIDEPNPPTREEIAAEIVRLQAIEDATISTTDFWGRLSDDEADRLDAALSLRQRRLLALATELRPGTDLHSAVTAAAQKGLGNRRTAEIMAPLS